MGKAINTLGKMISDPGEAITEMVNNDNLKWGFIVGYLSLWAVPISTLLSSILNNRTYDLNVTKEFIMIPILSIIYYSVHALGTYLLSRLFKGKGSFLSYASHLGWYYMPSVFISIAFTPIVLFPTLKVKLPELTILFKSVVSVGMIFVLVLTIWAIRIMINIYKYSIQLTTTRAVIVFLLSVIPYLIIYDWIF